MSDFDVRIRLEPIMPGEDGNTGHRWSASYDLEGDVPGRYSPQYDASGETIEDALARLCVELARALARDGA